MSKIFRNSDTDQERSDAAYRELQEKAAADQAAAPPAEDVPAEAAEAEQEKPARKSPAGRPGKKGVKKAK